MTKTKNTAPQWRPRSLVLASLLIFGVAGCATTPQTVTAPQLEMPADMQAQIGDLGQWWRQFQDPALTRLVEAALVHNAELTAAVARVDEASALLRESRSDLFPSLNAALGGNRTRSSQRGVYPISQPINNTFNLGLNMAYEVDLWGRVRSANRAALANLQSNREALAGLQSAIAAQTAQTYFNLLALDRKLVLTEQSLLTREEAVRLLNKGFEAGSASSLDLRLAEAERESLQAALPKLKNARSQTERALFVLVGASPREMAAGKIERAQFAQSMAAVPAAPAGLPSDLLARRPDIREAQARLEQSEAGVSTARAAYFPSLILTGSGGYQSTDLADFIVNPARVWSLAASLTQPIFGINQISARVDAAKARRAQAEAAYVAVVQNAFRETYDALETAHSAGDIAAAQSRRQAALAEALRLARLRFDAGAAAYLEVLDAQRSLYATQADWIDAQIAQRLASVDVFRALGGGWGMPASQMAGAK